MAVIVWLLACTQPPAETDPAETGTVDTAPDTDPGDTDPVDTDTGEVVETCTDGLRARVADVTLANGGTYDAGAAPTLADPVTVDLELENTCTHRLRFLGHPDDWLIGDGFTLDSLPPVYLEPGARTTLTIAFHAGPTGSYTANVDLPHDRPGSPFQLELDATSGAPLTFVAVGDGGHVMSTADYGQTASHDAFTTMTAHTASLIRGVCAGGGRFVAVGGNAERAWWTSTDGVTWDSGTDVGGVIDDCAYLNGRFIAVSYNPVWSTNGSTWTEGTGYLPDNVRAAAAGTDVVVAVGDAGMIATTANGDSWASIEQITTADFSHVAYGGGRFVVVGSGGATATSGDEGQTWALSNTGGSGSGGLVYQHGAFLVGDGATIYRSVDGVRWDAVNASNVSPRAAMAGVILGVVGNTLHRSYDGGFSWQAGVASAQGLGFLDGAFEVRP